MNNCPGSITIFANAGNRAQCLADIIILIKLLASLLIKNGQKEKKIPDASFPFKD